MVETKKQNSEPIGSRVSLICTVRLVLCQVLILQVFNWSRRGRVCHLVGIIRPFADIIRPSGLLDYGTPKALSVKHLRTLR